MFASENHKTKELYEFGPFRVDAEKETLLRAGEPIPLTPKTFQILLVLVRHSGQVVTKDDLMKTVWPDTFVEETNLTRNIFMLRKALGERPQDHRYVVTVPGRGYRLAEKVQVVADEEVSRVPASHSTVQIEAKETRPWGWIAAALILVCAVVGGSLWFALRPKVVLGEKDTVVLADFANRTGDQVFDGTLRQGLAVQLEQSPFLSLISERRIQHVLRLMGRSSDEQLTPELAGEICERTGSAAFVQGSIARLGSQYVVGLRAETQSGQVLDEEQAQVSRKEDVLSALDKTAIHLRGKLGESLGSVEKYNTPVEEATTPSLEALKAYSLGRKMFFEKGNAAALPFLKRAVEIDPKFAIAYRAMGAMYGNLGQQQRMAENVRKAYELRDKVSERERFYIEANYYWTGTGELEKAIPAYELWRQAYPRDYALYVHLSVIYGSLGDPEKGMEEARESVRLEPNVEYNYLSLIRNYIALNRLDEAEGELKQAEQRNFGGEDLPQLRNELAFLHGDGSKLLLAAKGQSSMGDLLLAQQANIERCYGRLKEAREVMRRAIDLAQRNDARETAAGYEAMTALVEVEAGHTQQARADADAAIKMSRNRNVLGNAALALALAGDVVTADKLAAELDRDFPLDTLVQRYRLPAIHAAVALQRKDAKRAVELLQVTDAIELGDYGLLLPVYLRGEAYLMLRDGKRAAAQFQKFVDHRGLVGDFAWGSLARLQLARALALSGDKTRARAAYRDFFTLWNEADSELTPLRQAKLEYAKLLN